MTTELPKPPGTRSGNDGKTARRHCGATTAAPITNARAAVFTSRGRAFLPHHGNRAGRELSRARRIRLPPFPPMQRPPSMPKTPPAVPTRTDAAVACRCGGIAGISAVAPIPAEPQRMRHTYHCDGCGADRVFDVMKKGVG